MIRKRSVEINGKLTSVTLEDIFWRELERIAKAECVTMQELINRIEAQRTMPNRSSALRVYAFEHALAHGKEVA